MKRWLCFVLCLLCLPLAGWSEEAAVEAVFSAPETTADGEIVPEKIRALIEVARAQFDRHNWEKLPKNNEYTRWYYGCLLYTSRCV